LFYTPISSDPVLTIPFPPFVEYVTPLFAVGYDLPGPDYVYSIFIGWLFNFIGHVTVIYTVHFNRTVAGLVGPRYYGRTPGIIASPATLVTYVVVHVIRYDATTLFLI